MSPQRIAGVVLLIIGVILLIVGVSASHSIADKTHDFIFGRYTHETALYLFGGGALAIAGFLMLVFGTRKA